MQWNYNQSDKTLTIRGEGPIKDYYWDDENGPDTPWKGLDIVKLVIQEGITSIGDGVFNHLNNLEEVKIPSTIINMKCPFVYCNKLRKVTIPRENKLYYVPGGNKWNLEEKGIIMEKSVEYNSNGQIYCINTDNSYLFKIIPVRGKFNEYRSTVATKIREKAAYGIDNEYSLNLNCSEFYKDLVIEKSAFEKSNIVSINLRDTEVNDPEGWHYFIKSETINVEIQDRAFCNCKKLTRVSIKNISSIGDKAFFGCSSLENISLTEATQYIGERAFEGCTNLVVTVPGSVFIGKDAFKDVKEVIYRGNSDWNDF